MKRLSVFLTQEKKRVILKIMDSEFVLVVEPQPQEQNKRPGGRPKGDFWEHFERLDPTSDGHAKAICKYCGKSWYRGEKTILVGHIANHCEEAPSSVIREYLMKMNETAVPGVSKKRRTNSDSGQTLLTETYKKIEKLNSACINRINRSLLKFFTCCGISFQIVEHPFFIDLIKELNPSYNLPSRELLSGRFLEEELSKVNISVTNELKYEKNLTLGKFCFI